MHRVRFPGGGAGNEKRLRQALLMGRPGGANLTSNKSYATIPPPQPRRSVIPVTPLLGTSFGVLPGLVAGRQAKIWFPGEFNAANLSVAIAARGRQSWATPDPPPIDFGIPTVPVVLSQPEFYPEPSVQVRPIFARPMGGGPSPVPRKTVVVEGTSTVIEEHPEGDFPAGSIFAPGAPWGGGVSSDLDVDEQPEEQNVGLWTELFSAGVDVLQGQYDMPTYGIGGPSSFVATPAVSNIPSGRAALPPGAAPVIGAANECGNRRYVTLDRQTGRVSCKRRRRRRLLTNRDLADLASLKTITGGGAALNAAVIRAVR